jgi:hypothetical protein
LLIFLETPFHFLSHLLTLNRYIDLKNLTIYAAICTQNKQSLMLAYLVVATDTKDSVANVFFVVHYGVYAK